MLLKVVLEALCFLIVCANFCCCNNFRTIELISTKLAWTWNMFEHCKVHFLPWYPFDVDTCHWMSKIMESIFQVKLVIYSCIIQPLLRGPVLILFSSTDLHMSLFLVLFCLKKESWFHSVALLWEKKSLLFWVLVQDRKCSIVLVLWLWSV